MNKPSKLLAGERREAMVSWLRASNTPITGGELAKRAGVSRQVIVQDMSILKAKDEPIFATAQGYMYLQAPKRERISRIVAVKHLPADTQRELYLLVDHGVTVKDVIVEHAIYGEITASLHVSNRQEVDAFCESVARTKANLLSELTEGVHLHTIEGDTREQIEAALLALKEEQILLEDNE
ncbi:transcription repressor NadR [Shouchella shacheensis]|uniref:transcription repressor NadR n=1 Tax=Shouchella shacheensis TaxID=1649580 RepID=UPI00073FD57F|nr:transcription repressor NadR [Shouchella shacheensis]